MTTSTRTSGTSIKRLLGADGSAKYQSKIGSIASLVTIPVAVMVTKHKVPPMVAGIITAAATTVAAIVIDKSADSYYTKTEYAIMFGTFSGIFAATFKSL